MRRRGFLGTMLAAVGARKLTQSTGVLAVVTDDPRAYAPEPLHYEGRPVVQSWPYEHQGPSFTMKDGTTQHLGPYGVLAAVTLPNGVTEFTPEGLRWLEDLNAPLDERPIGSGCKYYTP